MTLRPIQTTYKGYRFRSRLEARWAVFFDALQIPWRYEVEGYVLPDGSTYLPDFVIGEGHHAILVEVKGVVDETVWDRLRLVGQTYPIILLTDIPEDAGRQPSSDQWGANPPRSRGALHPAFDNQQIFWACFTAPKSKSRADGAVIAVLMPSPGHTTLDLNERVVWPAILDAYAKAQGARFEHGETPR